jgi:hypothetical protein
VFFTIEKSVFTKSGPGSGFYQLPFNGTELGIAEREIKRVKNGRFVLIPISDQTHGHGTHTWAAVWQQYLKELLETSQRQAGSN